MHPFKPDIPQPYERLPRPTEYPTVPLGRQALSGSMAHDESMLPPPSTVGDEPVETYAKITQAHTDEPSRAPQPPSATQPERSNTPPTAQEATLPAAHGALPPPIDPPQPPPVGSGETPDPNQPYEVRETPTQTILVNIHHPNRHLAEQAARQLANGIPATWQSLPLEGGSAGYYTDSSENPTLFLKSRGDTAWQQGVMERARQQDASRPPDEQDDVSYVQFATGYTEVVPEMEIAPQVQQAVSMPEAQHIVQELGYKEITVVTPVAAGINTQTGEKWTVSPYVKGHALPFLDSGSYDAPGAQRPRPDSGEPQDAINIDVINDRLRQHLKSRGIDPVDMSPADYFISTDQHGARSLHLLNISHFEPLQQPQLPATHPLAPSPEASKVGRPPIADAAKNLPLRIANDMAEYRQIIQDPRAYAYRMYPEAGQEQDEPVHWRRGEVGDYLTTFHGTNREEQRQLTVTDLIVASDVVLTAPPHEQAAQYGPAARTILQKVNELIKHSAAIASARLSLAELSTVSRTYLQPQLAKLNATPKDPVLFEYLRLGIPSFAWRPHAFPADIIPEELHQQALAAWSGYTVRDTHMLATAQELSANTVPLHIGFQAADKLKAAGYDDVAYSIKTNLISETLVREGLASSQLQKQGYMELPFYTHIVGGVLAGEVGISKGPIDYTADIKQTMAETWQHVIQEAKAGAQNGPAAEFMRDLAGLYGQSFVMLMAKSLGQRDVRLNIETVHVLNALRTVNIPHTDELVQACMANPKRSVLTAGEAAQLAHDTAPTPNVSPQQVSQAAATLSAHKDIYSFRSAPVATPQGATTVAVTLSSDSPHINATIRFHGRQQLSLPVRLDLSTEHLETTFYGDEALDPATAHTYIGAIRKAIMDNLAQTQAAEAERSKESTIIRARPADQPAQQPPAPEPKVKTTGAADPAYAQETEEEPETSQTTGIQTRITPIASEAIASMMRRDSIRGLESDDVLDGMNLLLDKANQTGRSFGKSVSSVNVLRQVNCTFSGRDMRLYFSEGNNNTLTLVGVYEKKGLNHQQAYLRKLAKRLAKQTSPPPGSGREKGR